jgi:hypothetical protein
MMLAKCQLTVVSISIDHIRFSSLTDFVYIWSETNNASRLLLGAYMKEVRCGQHESNTYGAASVQLLHTRTDRHTEGFTYTHS